MEQSINTNTHRGGNFTSSEISKLMELAKNGKDFGAPAITYIHEKNLERYLGRSIKNETNSRETNWGKLVEPYVFGEVLGTEYTYTSKETIKHPSIDCWAGSPDGCKSDTVYDIKCPFTPKSFAMLVLPLYLGFMGMDAMIAIRDGFEHDGFKFKAHTDGEKYYWQLVSNAILTSKDFAELIIYMPYESELLPIRQLNDQKLLDWLSDDEIPALPNDGYFKNINIIRFEVPQADKDAITAKAISASGLLVPRPQTEFNKAA